MRKSRSSSSKIQKKFEEPTDLPPFEPDFGCLIIVDNIPKVDPAKLNKLRGVILKTYTQIAEYITGDDIMMPMDPATGQSTGFCFIKFQSKSEAAIAVQETNGLELTKKNIFKVNLYSDLDKFNKLTEEFVAKDPPPFKPRPDPTRWLSDQMGRDQFVVRHNSETLISWASATVGEDPELEYGGEREKESGRVWCESYVSWSPQGTYLATFHEQGIKLWGGNEFEAQGRFIHSKVEEMSFSPCENYIITYRLFDQGYSAQDVEAIIVWDTRTGNKIKVMETKSSVDPKCHVQSIVVEEKTVKKVEVKGEEKPKAPEKKKIERQIRARIVSFDERSQCFKLLEGNIEHVVKADKVQPVQDLNRMKWSHDGKYLARLGCDLIQVYEMPSVTLLDRRSIAAKDVLDFQWSPFSNMISYWSPAAGNHPAFINIVSIPDRTSICSRQMFDVQDGRMVWQNDGEYLCVYMSKIQNKKKTYVLMLFRVKVNDVPVEQVELNEPVQFVAWEPSGDRFCVLHGEQRSSTISVYSMAGVTDTSSVKAALKGNTGKAPKKELTLLYSLSGKQCNEILWSPAGGLAAFAQNTSDSCVFELYDIDNNTSLGTKKHDRGNRLVWDPSGRIIASCTISNIRAKTRAIPDDGYNLYTFQGTLISSVKKEKLYQFSWRPRPKDLLSPEEKKKIIKNLKKYEKVFMQEDQSRARELNSVMMEERKGMAQKFLDFSRQRKAQYAAYKNIRVMLRDGYDSDDDSLFEISRVFHEKVLSSEKEVL